MRILIFCFLFLLVGCNVGDKMRKEIIDHSFESSKALEGKKVTRVRFNVNQVDLVTEDGNIISFFGYNVTNDGNYYQYSIGVK